MRVLDAALVSLAAGLTFVTLYVVRSDYPAGYVLRPPDFDVAPSAAPSREFLAIVLHGGPKCCPRSAPGSMETQAHFIVRAQETAPFAHVDVTPRWREQLPARHTRHAAANAGTIAVWIDPGPDGVRPTAPQVELARSLIGRLRAMYGWPPDRVVRHSDVDPSVSCASALPLARLRE